MYRSLIYALLHD